MKSVKVEGSEKGKLIGWFEWILRDKNGNIKSTGRTKNLVVNAGIGAITGLMLTDVGGTAFDYLAVGTDSTAPSATDTALGAEITDSGLARAAGTGSQETDTVTNDTAKLTYTWSNITASKSIRELGVFNAASGGTMLARANVTVDVSAGDSLTLTHKTKLSSA
ncbi:MAG: phage tail fiber protein [Candidatus Heimdallarchaeota archaeon]